MSGTFSYFAYGLGIHATMPLPELMAGKVEEKAVNIRFGYVDQPPPKALGRGWHFISTAPEEIRVFWPQVGSFLIKGGTDIVINPSPGLDERILRLFILGPILAILLRQRGHLLLHASAVAVADKAVLFLGGSGRGKSTMAAALHARGYDLVTDDVAVLRVEENCQIVFPGPPQLKLWPEVLVSLGDDPGNLPRLNPRLEKRTRLAALKFSSSPLPVKRIYVLNEGNASEILHLQPQEAFVELVRHTYGSDYSLQTAMGVGSASHFLQCANVANKVIIRSLRRQKSFSQLSVLARLIEEDLTQSK
jgi:hypothetical protein